MDLIDDIVAAMDEPTTPLHHNEPRVAMTPTTMNAVGSATPKQEDSLMAVAENMNGHTETATPKQQDVAAMMTVANGHSEAAVTPMQKVHDPMMIDTTTTTPMSNGSTRRSRKRTTPTTVDSKPPPRKKGKTKQKKADEMSWICIDCKEAEAMDDPEADLIVCEGLCNRPYHTICAGLKETPKGDETWVCSDCTRGSHMCTICQEYGRDGVDVFRCKISDCGLFFHESCLSTYNVDVQLVPTAAGNGETATPNDESAPEPRPVFRCPAHQCWTCTEEMTIEDEGEGAATVTPTKPKGKGGKKKKKGKKKKENVFGTKPGHLFRCLECPIAYHISCIPPFARFHELALLCHDHAATCKLPALDMETSVQAQIERAADEQMESMANSKHSSVRKGNKKFGEQNIFFLGLRGDAITGEEDKLLRHVEDYVEQNDESAPFSLRHLTFCLPCDLKDEVHSKPPSYRAVHTLRYDSQNRPKRKAPSGDVCRCKANNLESCDENCHNRMMFMECVGDPTKLNGAKNTYWNCDLGPNCGNRAMGQRKAVKCKPQREKGKGWGLIPLVPLKKGGLAHEYVGEVIDAKTKEERLTSWSSDHPNDPNFYIMQLDPGWFIDARVEANLSRFINHSCDPNCVLRPFNVSGYSRVGVYALRDISPGEFLSYDYQFDTKHGDKFICRCGAAKCRGTMKGGKQNSEQAEDEKKTAKQALAAAKVKMEKDKKYLEDVVRIKAEKFSQVDVLIPGYEYPNETVALGPFERYKLEGQQNRIFLWRNAQRGSAFSNRAFLLKTKQKTQSPPIDTPKIDVLAILQSKSNLDSSV